MRALIIQWGSLYMACTGCQNVTTQSWLFWSQFCDQVYVTQYPQVIPLGTAVPHWAYLNYTVRAQCYMEPPTSHFIDLDGKYVRSCRRKGSGWPPGGAGAGPFDC